MPPAKVNSNALLEWRDLSAAKSKSKKSSPHHIKGLLKDLGKKEVAENCEKLIDNAAALHARIMQNGILSYTTKHVDIIATTWWSWHKRRR
jgi:hypothetical protein